MKKNIAFVLLIISFAMIGCGKKSSNPSPASSMPAETLSKKKVLYIDSYFRGYEWNDGITNGILEVFGAKLNDDDTVDNSQSKVELRIVRMDTKRHGSEEFKKQAGLIAKDVIESWRPDVVITSDDNAFKYVIADFYRDTNLPVVFCGLNWDASLYGAPYKNTTGMVEVSLIEQVVEQLKKYAKGSRMGFLGEECETTRKEALYYKKLFKMEFAEEYVTTFAQWKSKFLDMQEKFDLVLMYNNAAINDWNKEEAAKFAFNNTKIPVGGVMGWMAPYSLLIYSTAPEEQGQWSANAALEILNGRKPSDIPLVTNKTAKIFLNMKMAKKLGIVFPIELVNQAEFVE